MAPQSAVNHSILNDWQLSKTQITVYFAILRHRKSIIMTKVNYGYLLFYYIL